MAERRWTAPACAPCSTPRPPSPLPVLQALPFPCSRSKPSPPPPLPCSRSKPPPHLARPPARRAAPHLAAPRSTAGSRTVTVRKTIKIGRPGYKVVKQRDPATGQKSLLFEINYPDIDKGFQPRHRFMSAYEQRVEAPDKRYQCVPTRARNDARLPPSRAHRSARDAARPQVPPVRRRAVRDRGVQDPQPRRRQGRGPLPHALGPGQEGVHGAWRRRRHSREAQPWMRASDVHLTCARARARCVPRSRPQLQLYFVAEDEAAGAGSRGAGSA